jgi:hypothetical protein
VEYVVMEKFTLSYKSAYPGSAETAVVVSFEATDIDTLLNHIRDFIQAAGYSTATQLVALTDDGIEWGRSDR